MSFSEYVQNLSDSSKDPVVRQIAKAFIDAYPGDGICWDCGDNKASAYGVDRNIPRCTPCNIKENYRRNPNEDVL